MRRAAFFLAAAAAAAILFFLPAAAAPLGSAAQRVVLRLSDARYPESGKFSPGVFPLYLPPPGKAASILSSGASNNSSASRAASRIPLVISLLGYCQYFGHGDIAADQNSRIFLGGGIVERMGVAMIELSAPFVAREWCDAALNAGFLDFFYQSSVVVMNYV